MKYLYYLWILLCGVKKVIGVGWFWVAVPFRGYARNVVYNYVLQGSTTLKRLQERTITLVGDTYIIGSDLDNPTGFIKKREISNIEYHLVFWLLWGWVDDDSNYDTTDLGYLTTLVDGTRNKPITMFFLGKWIKKWQTYLIAGNVTSLNSWDGGDKRSEEPFCKFAPAWVWLLRNTAYNFQYKQRQICNESLVWQSSIPWFNDERRYFGWKEDGSVNGVAYYKFIFFETI